MVNKEYILSRLAAGESIQEIGDSLAQVMNEAMAEHTAAIEAEKKAAAEKIQKQEKKKDLALAFIAVLQDYARVCDVDPALLGELSETDTDELIEQLDQIMELAVSLQTLSEVFAADKAIATNKVVPVKSDDEIIKAFLRSF